MKPATFIGMGGISAALGVALFVGPAATASAAPSTRDSNAAPTPSAHATTNRWLATAIDHALTIHLAQIQAQLTHAQGALLVQQKQKALADQKLAAAQEAQKSAQAADVAAKHLLNAAALGVLVGITSGNTSMGTLAKDVRDDNRALTGAVVTTAKDRIRDETLEIQIGLTKSHIAKTVADEEAWLKASQRIKHEAG